MQQQIGDNIPGKRPAGAKRGRAVGRQGLAQRLFSRPRWGIAVIAILIGVVALIGTMGARPKVSPSVAAESTDMAPEVGKLAPTFSLATPEGAPVSLASLRGQVVLVNFWATWCPPCRAEMPAIEAAYERYGGQGFAVVAVTANEQPADVTDFFNSRGLSFPALLDDGRVHAAYRASGLPSSFFIDRQGVVRAVYRGAMSDAVITSEVERLLSE
ncbi:TlpA family protein disulfide reductase [Chloroflexales bacterium ZM16-3]|nr:TlpA family protein disulfide reductase [Chloroflexales bacterium ZM16-3]